MHNMKFVAARPCLHASTAAALERHCHGAPRAPLHAVWAGGRWPAMGKCYKCTSAQASYYDPDNGPGRYCKQCAKTVPGAVSRWQKDKQKAAAAATEAAAALAAVGGACSSTGSSTGSGTGQPKGKGKSNGKRTRTGYDVWDSGGPPISLGSLGLSPFVAAVLAADWLEQRLSTVFRICIRNLLELLRCSTSAASSAFERSVVRTTVGGVLVVLDDNQGANVNIFRCVFFRTLNGTSHKIQRYVGM